VNVERNEATMRVRSTPLLAPVLSRVIGMLAARAQFPIDRLDDALLVADAVAAHSPEFSRADGVLVAVAAAEGTLELTVSELRPQGARGLLADAELPGVGNVLERVADEVRAEANGDGERLYIRLGLAG
jgi:hypothetical protein